MHQELQRGSPFQVMVLLGPIFFEETVNSECYLSMLRNTFLHHHLATNSVVHAGWNQAAHSKYCLGLSA
jgi:hypothetical protein